MQKCSVAQNKDVSELVVQIGKFANRKSINIRSSAELRTAFNQTDAPMEGS